MEKFALRFSCSTIFGDADHIARGIPSRIVSYCMAIPLHNLFNISSFYIRYSGLTSVAFLVYPEGIIPNKIFPLLCYLKRGLFVFKILVEIIAEVFFTLAECLSDWPESIKFLTKIIFLLPSDIHFFSIVSS